MRPSNLSIALIVGIVGLFSQAIYYSISAYYSQAKPFKLAEEGWADLSQRVTDYPQTYISAIQVDLTSPQHEVRLEWSGPQAEEQETGPFHSSPGVGTGGDCNEYEESRRLDSCCTPKGEWQVEGFNDYLPSISECKHATWFHIPRQIALHSHVEVPFFPASHGCVRLNSHPAQLIHNNSVAGKTRVIVDGNWTPPPSQEVLMTEAR